MTRQILIAATAMALFTSGAYAAGTGNSGDAAQTQNQTTQGSSATGSATQDNRAAMQTCSQELTRVNEEIGMSQSGARSREIRTLHEAAMIFGRNGQTEACRQVTEGLQKYMKTAAAAPAGRTEPGFQKQVENARPLDEMEGTIRASELIGADVVSTKGETLGDVDDVVMSPTDDTRYLLVGSGGFLELGEKYVPVKSSEIRVIDRDTLVLDVEETAFQDAPRFDMDTIESKTKEWTNDVAAWWKENVTQRAN